MRIAQTQRVLALALVVSLSCAVGADAALIEDFDGSGNTPFNFTNTSGGAPSITNGGASGNFARIGNLNGSNNNSIAFDENPSVTGPQPNGLRLAFDFRLSTDASNDDAGGCCGSAADGIGIGLFATSTYGATGGTNPADGGAVWERPANPDSFAIGFDIFQNIDQVNLNWGGAEVANADVQPFLNLNSGKLHRAIVDVAPDGAGNGVVDMQILEDIHGASKMHDIFSNQTVTGMDPNALPAFRLIAGARTGGAFHDGDIDNVYLASVPEPSSLTLLAISGLMMLAGLRRRNG